MSDDLTKKYRRKPKESVENDSLKKPKFDDQTMENDESDSLKVVPQSIPPQIIYSSPQIPQRPSSSSSSSSVPTPSHSNEPRKSPVHPSNRYSNQSSGHHSTSNRPSSVHSSSYRPSSGHHSSSDSSSHSARQSSHHVHMPTTQPTPSEPKPVYKNLIITYTILAFTLLLICFGLYNLLFLIEYQYHFITTVPKDERSWRHFMSHSFCPTSLVLIKDRIEFSNDSNIGELSLLFPVPVPIPFYFDKDQKYCIPCPNNTDCVLTLDKSGFQDDNVKKFFSDVMNIPSRQEYRPEDRLFVMNGVKKYLGHIDTEIKCSKKTTKPVYPLLPTFFSPPSDPANFAKSAPFPHPPTTFSTGAYCKPLSMWDWLYILRWPLVGVLGFLVLYGLYRRVRACFMWIVGKGEEDEEEVVVVVKKKKRK